eukprot:3869492-Pleurochrysis_carterae.AAC.1
MSLLDGNLERLSRITRLQRKPSQSIPCVAGGVQAQTHSNMGIGRQEAFVPVRRGKTSAVTCYGESGLHALSAEADRYPQVFCITSCRNA